jgi:uncharacterized damage-inducible protein DinB
MKDHFINLFNYDHHINQKITAAILSANAPQKAVQLMAHLLATPQVWLSRCTGQPVTVAIWPDWQADVFEQTINANHAAWLNYLNGLTTADLEKAIAYKNSKGQPFNTKLINILSHVVNHGTHHRAQIGQQLKFAGVDELPVTDYIYYIWNQK